MGVWCGWELVQMSEEVVLHGRGAGRGATLPAERRGTQLDPSTHSTAAPQVPTPVSRSLQPSHLHVCSIPWGKTLQNPSRDVRLASRSERSLCRGLSARPQGSVLVTAQSSECVGIKLQVSSFTAEQ
ncbi:hypothetical protein AV530_020187 [Patagioenas fasciata monilis]|uniref:Uncharacterized protein n=1 Tax=Patagioenas fasciata monilis TaxID=372326 RepID=A0A1V4KZP7_PATFA|nr:hypothetical protein AV530_020187 [Patagioenas fasciata monilis]